MAVISHMRLKHPEIRGVGLSSSKSYDNSRSNSGSNPNSTFGSSNPVPVPNSTIANGDHLSHSGTPAYLGHKPQESLKIQQEERIQKSSENLRDRKE